MDLTWKKTRFRRKAKTCDEKSSERFGRKVRPTCFPMASYSSRCAAHVVWDSVLGPTGMNWVTCVTVCPFISSGKEDR